VLIALHAQRSAAAVRGFRERYPDRPIALVLTGTDLYRDIAKDAAARKSLQIADRIVVLQDDAVRHVPAAHRGKVTVIFQSARALRPATKARNTLNAVVVGHLRAVKDPATVFRALEAVPPEVRIRVRHIGASLDASLGRQAAALSRSDRRYRWSGSLSHGLTRAAIKRAHVLVHPSILEGGANVIVEAIVSGTAVIASRMSGNIGMLGADHPGLFPVGDARALARLLTRAASEPAFLEALGQAGNRRKSLFRPETEAAAVRRLVRGLLR
jgi:putative glycosyltransferase (TIGR04348 family)